MADFNEAIPLILAHEGGYVNNPSDPGGETNFGISKRSYPELDIANLTQEEAIEIYKRDWWDKYCYEVIHDQALATKVFDMAINMCAKEAHELLQRACNEVAGNWGTPPLEVDGILGSKTFVLVNQLDATRLLYALRNNQSNYYRALVRQKPELAKFLQGWLNRAAE